MIKQLKSDHPKTLIYELYDFITKDEIDKMSEGIATALQNFEKVNLMLILDVKRETLGSLIEEFQLGIKYWNRIGKIAYLANNNHLSAFVEVDNLFTKFKEKYFGLDQISEAWDWINEN